MKEQTILKAEAPSTDLLMLGAQSRLLKAHIKGYTREDGTAVQAHERGGTAKPAMPLAEKIAQHKTLIATHERAVAKAVLGSPQYGAHVVLLGLHRAAFQYANIADAGATQAERDSAAKALAALRREISRDESALKSSGKAAPAAAGQVMSKARRLTPVMFKISPKKKWAISVT